MKDWKLGTQPREGVHNVLKDWLEKFSRNVSFSVEKIESSSNKWLQRQTDSSGYRSESNPNKAMQPKLFTATQIGEEFLLDLLLLHSLQQAV